MKNKFLHLVFLSISLVFFSNNLFAQCCDKAETENCCSKNICHADHEHALTPIGIMGDHCHPKGGLMLSYRYMNMSMKDNLSSSDQISNEAIFGSFMMAPQDMQMQMHMIGMMYGLSDQITLMGMLNYQKNDMDMVMMNGHTHAHSSSGIGDLKIRAITKLWNSKNQSIHFDLGLSIPTGDIDQKEMNHLAHTGGDAHEKVVMPYPMRLGSGTYDVLIGGTYTVNWNRIAVGLQPGMTLRTQKNDRDYRLGNQYKINAWVGYKINNWLGLSLRGEYLAIQKIKGIDEGLMPMMSPPNNVMNTGSDRIFAHVGFNIGLPKVLNGLEIGAEFGMPFYQRVEGIQMDYNNLMTIGVKGNIL